MPDRPPPAQPGDWIRHDERTAGVWHIRTDTGLAIKAEPHQTVFIKIP